MQAISPIYEEYLRRFDREFVVKALIGSEEHDRSKIVDLTIENSLTLSDGFEIGNAIPGKMTIRLRGLPELPANERIVPYIAVSLARMTWAEATIAWQDDPLPWEGGNSEWLPFGEFFVDSREKVNNVWVYTCYDKLVMADVPYVSSLTYPATQQAVFAEICGLLSFTVDSSVVINPAYTVPIAQAGLSCRQVLGYIAGANCGSFFIGKDGLLKMKRFVPDDEPVFNMGLSDYIRAKQTNPVKSYSRVVVTYDTEDDMVYESGSGDENHTLYLENPLATQAIADALCVSLSGISYLPHEMDARGFPHLETGDRIAFGLYEGSSWMEALLPWMDEDLPWDGVRQYRSYVLHQTLTFRGGLQLKVEAPSVSEQQSEFVVEGTLSAQVNKLDKTAVKEAKRYYGVTVTRTEGLTVQTDAGAKSVLNADELSFYTDDGDRALWFDLISRRFKFSGTLEAVDGIFSGDLSAAGGTFTGDVTGGRFIGGEIAIGSGDDIFKANSWGIWLGDSTYADAPFKVDMAGHMDAVDAKFQGEINASTINGANINGGTVTGALIQTSEAGIYPWAAMSSTDKTFSVAASSSSRVEITSFGYPSASLGINFINGSQTSVISGNSGLYLYGDDTITMEAMNIFIRGYNGAYVSRWSELRSEETGVSMQEELNNLDSSMDYLASNLTFDPSTRNLKLWSRGGFLLAQVNIPDAT
ncbi:hypothetical protein [Paenibacillus sp. URB8-2]|uniref:hypothetical protein n=1 Tax=Paenibacillus sp. URB8-2 TaxID=2741301 RepID=UPI0015BCFDF8|nr:hypothetical protein [Paenibacillus sp. URB8-2]BCG57491.1 hypothetical protein PUR_09160 [Paenibacillus sp. URB8-2]